MKSSESRIKSSRKIKSGRGAARPAGAGTEVRNASGAGAVPARIVAMEVLKGGGDFL